MKSWPEAVIKAEKHLVACNMSPKNHKNLNYLLHTRNNTTHTGIFCCSAVDAFMYVSVSTCKIISHGNALPRWPLNNSNKKPH